MQTVMVSGPLMLRRALLRLFAVKRFFRQPGLAAADAGVHRSVRPIDHQQVLLSEMDAVMTARAAVRCGPEVAAAFRHRQPPAFHALWPRGPRSPSERVGRHAPAE